MARPRWLSPEQIAAHQQRRRLGEVTGVSACASLARLHAPESDVLKAVLGTLSLHPRVAWAARVNSGVFEVDGRFVKASFRGCSDIIGMLKGGTFLAVECKSSKGRETSDQAAFGQAVAKDGGMYVVARSVDDVMTALA